MQLDEASNPESRPARAPRLDDGELRSAAPLDDGPPIYDPYVAHPEPTALRPAREHRATVLRSDWVGSARPGALASAALPPETPIRAGDWSFGVGIGGFLLPLMAPVALLLGVVGLVRARKLADAGVDASRSRRRARIGIALALSQIVLVGLGLGLAAVRYRNHGWAPPQPRQAEARKPAPIPIPDEPSPFGTVPQKTQDELIGKVHVVTLGVQEASLEAALRREIDTAKAAGTEVLLVTTRSGCEPCDGLQASFPDPLMQSALERTRVVVVDVDVYGDDLDGQGIDRSVLAGFFLLGPDLHPRDAIHGGEWGDDIAPNIAPVLGPFVRGDFDHRKFDYRLARRFPSSERRVPPPRRAAPGLVTPAPPPSGVWL